jgi:hypothetical protein
MSNKAGKAYGMTLLCPIKGDKSDASFGDITRDRLEDLPLDDKSPMSKIPDTYLCRFYILDDIKYQGYPAQEEHLKSRYLVFCTNFHGKRDDYLKNMWEAIEHDVQHIWEYCVAFDRVKTAQDFVTYAKKCQVWNNLFFNGSTDDSLAEQLKALYLKQEFSRFAFNNHGASAADLQKAFQNFITIVQPDNLQKPSWVPGMTQEHSHHHYTSHLHPHARRP